MCAYCMCAHYMCTYYMCVVILSPEPAILLMHHSLRSHPQITASLLDFLCRVRTTPFDLPV